MKNQDLLEEWTVNKWEGIRDIYEIYVLNKVMTFTIKKEYILSYEILETKNVWTLMSAWTLTLNRNKNELYFIA